LAKILEFTGMSIIAVTFYISFPDRISYESFIVGAAFFLMGFLIEKFVLK